MIPNPWVIVGFLVALALVGWQSYEAGDTHGAARVELTWQTREAKINADAAVKIAAADKRVADIERQMATNLSAVDTSYQGKLKEKDNALQTALNAVRSGAVRLSGHGATCPTADRNAAGSAAASAGSGDGAAPARLFNDADWIFLQSEASRADKVVEQLTACQGVVTADRTPAPP